MIDLSQLKPEEIAQVEAVLILLDGVLDLLIERAICNEAEGVRLIDLRDALLQEQARRALETAASHIQQAVKAGDLMEVLRPDGEIGYALTGAWAELEAMR